MVTLYAVWNISLKITLSDRAFCSFWAQPSRHPWPYQTMYWCRSFVAQSVSAARLNIDGCCTSIALHRLLTYYECLIWVPHVLSILTGIFLQTAVSLLIWWGRAAIIPILTFPPGTRVIVVQYQFSTLHIEFLKVGSFPLAQLRERYFVFK